jgi:hypothetical protein
LFESIVRTFLLEAIARTFFVSDAAFWSKLKKKLDRGKRMNGQQCSRVMRLFWKLSLFNLDDLHFFKVGQLARGARQQQR